MRAGYSEKNKVKTYLLLLLAVLAITLTGCKAGKDEEESAGDGERQTGLFQEEAGTLWSDSWVTETADGKELNVSVNALISVPDAEKMSVAEVREFVFDNGSKKQIAEAIFGNEVYSYETEQLPKELLETELKEAEERLEQVGKEKEEAGENADELGLTDEYRAVQDEVKYLEKLLKKAKTEFTLASEDDYKADELIGERDGIRYILKFESGQSNNASMSPYDLEDVCPEELKGMDIVSWSGLDKSIGDNDSSAEEAKKKAEDFLSKTGFSNMVCRDGQALIWKAEPTEGTGDTGQQKVQTGYTFSFGPGTGGDIFIDPDAETLHYSDYVNAIMQQENGNELNYPLGSEIRVDVTEKGVISAYWDSPVMIMSLTDDVKLLSIPDIQKIMKESIGNYIGEEYGVAKTHLSLNRMELVYFRLKDDTREGYYSYVPVWSLNEDTDYCRCMVNAIDGTVINVRDQLTAE